MSEDRENLRQEREELAAGESELLHDLSKGALAGLIATIPVALIAVLKQVLAVSPQLVLVDVLTRMTGIPWSGTGWVLLFVIGAVIGMGFASLDAHVADTTARGEMIRGAFFGFLLWVILLLLLVPLYDNEGFSTMFAGGLLAACLIFGAVMGLAYERMKPEHVA